MTDDEGYSAVREATALADKQCETLRHAIKGTKFDVNPIQQARTQAIDDCIKVVNEYAGCGVIASRLEALKGSGEKK